MIFLDKFYTPSNIAKYCIDLIRVTLDNFTISEWLEPSAGSGSFSNLIDCIAYDIEPEGQNIKQADFLALPLEYKVGRIVFGNPPFGKRLNLAKQFYKKSAQISDAIAFILPVSQLNNSDSLYEFDLISSTDLGKLEYSGVKVHCCFNIYTRPPQGLKKRSKLESNMFDLIRTSETNFAKVIEDFKIIKRGKAGTIVTDGKVYGDEYKVIVHDKANVEFVKNRITAFDWENFKIHQSAPNISKNDIYRLFQGI